MHNKKTDFDLIKDAISQFYFFKIFFYYAIMF